MATSFFFRCFNRGTFNCNNMVCCGRSRGQPSDVELEKKIEESIAEAETRFEIDKLAEVPNIRNLMDDPSDIVLMLVVNTKGDLISIEGEGKRLLKGKRTIDNLESYLQPKLSKLIRQLYNKTLEEQRQVGVMLRFENYDFVLTSVPVPEDDCGLVMLVKKVHFLL